jgi:hypothetical protein
MHSAVEPASKGEEERATRASSSPIHQSSTSAVVMMGSGNHPTPKTLHRYHEPLHSRNRLCRVWIVVGSVVALYNYKYLYIPPPSAAPQSQSQSLSSQTQSQQLISSSSSSPALQVTSLLPTTEVGGLFFCGYNTVELAQALFPEYAANFMEGLDDAFQTQLVQR